MIFGSGGPLKAPYRPVLEYGVIPGEMYGAWRRKGMPILKFFAYSESL
jgi:hypothetical protein